MFESFQELDWRPLVTEIERLEGERRELEEGSDILRTLQQQLAAIGSRRPRDGDAADQRPEETRPARKNGANRLGNCCWRCDALLAGTSEEVKSGVFPRLES